MDTWPRVDAFLVRSMLADTPCEISPVLPLIVNNVASALPVYILIINDVGCVLFSQTVPCLAYCGRLAPAFMVSMASVARLLMSARLVPLVVDGLIGKSDGLRCVTSELSG